MSKYLDLEGLSTYNKNIKAIMPRMIDLIGNAGSLGGFKVIPPTMITSSGTVSDRDNQCSVLVDDSRAAPFRSFDLWFNGPRYYTDTIIVRSKNLLHEMLSENNKLVNNGLTFNYDNCNKFILNGKATGTATIQFNAPKISLKKGTVYKLSLRLTGGGTPGSFGQYLYIGFSLGGGSESQSFYLSYENVRNGYTVVANNPYIDNFYLQYTKIGDAGFTYANFELYLEEASCEPQSVTIPMSITLEDGTDLSFDFDEYSLTLYDGKVTFGDHDLTNTDLGKQLLSLHTYAEGTFIHIETANQEIYFDFEYYSSEDGSTTEAACPLRYVVFLTQEQYDELQDNDAVTANGITIERNDRDMFLIPDTKTEELEQAVSSVRSKALSLSTISDDHENRIATLESSGGSDGSSSVQYVKQLFEFPHAVDPEYVFEFLPPSEGIWRVTLNMVGGSELYNTRNGVSLIDHYSPNDIISYLQSFDVIVETDGESFMRFISPFKYRTWEPSDPSDPNNDPILSEEKVLPPDYTYADGTLVAEIYVNGLPSFKLGKSTDEYYTYGDPFYAFLKFEKLSDEYL